MQIFYVSSDRIGGTKNLIGTSLLNSNQDRCGLEFGTFGKMCLEKIYNQNIELLNYAHAV